MAKVKAKKKKKAQKIDKVKVKMGRLIRVKNTKRPKFSNANTEYTAVKVEDAGGDNERVWFLTDKDMEMLDHRSERNREDWIKTDFWTDLLD
jgi:hypothetical protein